MLISPIFILFFKLVLELISLILIFILKLVSHIFMFSLKFSLHIVVFVCQIKSKILSFIYQRGSLGILLRSQSIPMSLKLIMCSLILLEMISLHSFFLIFVCKIVLIIFLLLSFNCLIQIFNVFMQSVLEFSMSRVVLVHLLHYCFNMGVEFDTFVFRVVVLNGRIFSMVCMIIDDRTLSIQCNDSCLQSFNLNLLFWNCHLSLMKLILNIHIWFVHLLLRNECSWCSLFFWTAWSNWFSRGTHRIDFSNKT